MLTDAAKFTANTLVSTMCAGISIATVICKHGPNKWEQLCNQFHWHAQAESGQLWL